MKAKHKIILHKNKLLMEDVFRIHLQVIKKVLYVKFFNNLDFPFVNLKFRGGNIGNVSRIASGFRKRGYIGQVGNTDCFRSSRF
jgi:hypothetical protein